MSINQAYIVGLHGRSIGAGGLNALGCRGSRGMSWPCVGRPYRSPRQSDRTPESGLAAHPRPLLANAPASETERCA
jgi:hypothetical protein